MSKYNLFISILLVGMIITAWFGFKHYENELAKVNKTNQELTMKANLPIGRADTSFEDVKKYMSDLSADIKKDIQSQNAKLDSFGELQAKYSAHNSGTLTTPQQSIIYRDVPGSCPVAISAPFSFKDFRLDASGDAVKKNFTYTLSQKFEVTTAESKLSNGGINNYAELYELDASGKRVGKMELTKYNVYHSPIDPKKFKYWDPALDILFGGLVDKGYQFGINGNVGLSFFSYGRYRNLDWRFLRLATGINKDGLEFSFSPAQYNVAQPLPLINNLWLTPSVGYILDAKIYYLGFGIAALL